MTQGVGEGQDDGSSNETSGDESGQRRLELSHLCHFLLCDPGQIAQLFWTLVHLQGGSLPY